MKLFSREEKPPAQPLKGRIGIIGAGALGAFYGARLSRAGHDVHLLMRSDYEVVRADGLQIKSFEGDFEVRPPVYRTAEDLGPCDLVIIGLKSTDNRHLPGLLRPTVGENTIILTLQNGLGNEEQISAAIPAANSDFRIIGGTAFLCSNRIAPAVIHHSDHGWIRMAEFRGNAQDRTRSVAALFTSAGIRCEVSDSLLHVRWEKLVWNIPFNGLGVAAHKADTAAVISSESLAATARGLMEEVVAAARSDGVTIDPATVDRMMSNTTSMGAYKSSMQVDYVAGRSLEVEAIIGEPLRRATRAHIQVPRIQMLYGIVSRLNGLSVST